MLEDDDGGSRCIKKLSLSMTLLREIDIICDNTYKTHVEENDKTFKNQWLVYH
jgi:hypothetical protein